MKKTIARPYSKAIYEHAKQESTVDSWSEALQMLSIISDDESIREIATNPNFSIEKLQEVLLSVTEDFSPSQQNLIKLLVQNRRLNIVGEILEQFAELKAEDESLKVVSVTSAYELSESEISDIVKALEVKFSGKVSVETSIDASLIGGLVIKYGDMVINTSISNQVEQFSNNLSV